MTKSKTPGPARINALLKRALEQQQAGDFVSAEKLYREVLAADPDNADAYNMMGVMAHKLGQLDIATGMIGRAIQLNGQIPVFYHNLAAVFWQQGKLDHAITLYNQAIGLNPSFHEAHASLGKTYLDANRLSEAKRALTRALELQPDYAFAQWNLGFAHLLEGDFAKGWPGHESRWRLPNARQHGIPGPEWDGTDLSGKTILLHCEQGIGDAIEFIRFVPLVKAMGAHIILFSIEQTGRLFANLPYIDTLIVGHTDRLPPYDYHLPLMSLPLKLGITLDTLPAKVPYLQPDPEEVTAWKNRLAELKGLKIGIAWRGNPSQANDHNRSATAALFAQALDVPGLAIVNLQKDARSEELELLETGQRPFYNAAPELHDLMDTAAVIVNLDLVISVDTAVCHLAGALGAMAWTLLCFAPDWRWMTNRLDSPWYPTMRLFRQKTVAGWMPVMDDVRQALKDRLSR